MANSTLLFKNPPSLLGQYARALLAKGHKGSEKKLPNVHAWLCGVTPDPKKVAAYAKVCGFEAQDKVLPLTYPHMLAFPLHLELMLQPSFPFPLMGQVHIRNQITQHRTLTTDDKLDVHCYFADLTETDKGLEFDIRTEISSAGILLWESISTNLVRKRSSGSKPKGERPAPEVFAEQERWNLASNLGRRYAKISGDSNPIHLFKFSAKLFGFKGHIAHGMWSKARSAASLHPQLNAERCQLSCEFKLPIFLPNAVSLNWNSADANQEVHFELRNPNGDKTHLKGSIKAL